MNIHLIVWLHLKVIRFQTKSTQEATLLKIKMLVKVTSIREYNVGNTITSVYDCKILEEFSDGSRYLPEVPVWCMRRNSSIYFLYRPVSCSIMVGDWIMMYSRVSCILALKLFHKSCAFVSSCSSSAFRTR